VAVDCGSSPNSIQNGESSKIGELQDWQEISNGKTRLSKEKAEDGGHAS
jgi:hypothetical protein